ncbi:MAG: sulfatase-like hydrolase/transferase [Planctomyces sp.]
MSIRRVSFRCLQGAVWVWLLLSCVPSVSDTQLAAEDLRRNLLLITADDMNADSPGWMGNPLQATPVLDAFAATAHRFRNHHVTVPICQPGRQALMTGLVPHRSGGLGFNPINSGTVTLTALLQQRGWFTGVIDKHPHMKPDAEFPWDVKLSGGGKNPELMRQHMDQLLQQSTAAGKPFFINANITDPHRPFPGSAQTQTKQATKQGTDKKQGRQAQRQQVAEQFVGRAFAPRDVQVPDFLEELPAVRREVASYCTAMARLDQTLDSILQALQASGRADNTIVVFLSDHGMSFPFSKASVYRNGTWSPVLLRYPGMPAAAVHDEFVSSVDLLPTLLDLLSVSHPEGLNGRSWLPLLNGETQPQRDAVVTHVNSVSSGKNFPQRCIRTASASLMFHAWSDGTAQFRVEAMSGLTWNALVAAAESSPQIAARVRQFQTGEPLMFFDLTADPTERHNLIADPAAAAQIQQLGERLLQHMEQTQDPQTDAFRAALAEWRGQR